jgi:uncharacterized membrane protein
MRIITAAAAAAILLVCASASAHGPERSARFRVEEIHPPASLLGVCLPGYRTIAQPATLNDFGVANANFNCYSQVDPVAHAATQAAGPFVWASWFGPLELRDGDDEAHCCSFTTRLNNRGEVFGSEVVNGKFEGVRWTLAGGLETIFPNDPQCEIIRLDIAVAGNGRYTLGMGLRPSSDFPFPGFCLTPTWLTRMPSGVVVQGPLRAEPRDINAFNQAVGVEDNRTAFRYQVPTGEMRVLRAGDDTHQVLPMDINDAGEVAGYEQILDDDEPCRLESTRALHWDRDDRETVLPLLPGATSARAWHVGHDGDVVGESGPGRYCSPEPSSDERAVLWRDGKAIDLITLTSASSVNRRGQITAMGYRDDEPLGICPRFVSDPQTGETVLDLSTRCRNVRSYLLTPR